MIITCPACSIRYVGDPEALGASGRMVRCAKCGHSWLQLPPADMPKQVDVPAPEPQPRRPALVARPRSKGGLGGRSALALAGAAIGAALLVGFFARESIVAAWPETRQLYEMVGVRATAIGDGLELVNVTFVLRDVDGEALMTVEGEIANKTAEPQPLPALKATLRNDQNHWLSDWVFSLDETTIQPGESLRFETATKNPPKDAKRLLITFTEQ